MNQELHEFQQVERRRMFMSFHNRGRMFYEFAASTLLTDAILESIYKPSALALLAGGLATVGMEYGQYRRQTHSAETVFPNDL